MLIKILHSQKIHNGQQWMTFRKGGVYSLEESIIKQLAGGSWYNVEPYDDLPVVITNPATPGFGKCDVCNLD